MVRTARDGEKRRSSQNSRNHSTRIIRQDEKIFRKNKAPHDDRLLDPRPGLSLISAANGQNQARLELVDQLNAEEVGVKLVKAAINLTGSVIEVSFSSTMQPSGGHVDLHAFGCLERRTESKPPAIGIRNDGRPDFRSLNLSFSLSL